MVSQAPSFMPCAGIAPYKTALMSESGSADCTTALPASGQYTVAVELRYQSIGYRWAHNLAAYDAPEPKRFVSYYTATSSASSVIIASATATTR